jgi:hypothetical protein
MVGTGAAVEDGTLHERVPPSREKAGKPCRSGEPVGSGFLYAHDAKAVLHAIEHIEHAPHALQRSHQGASDDVVKTIEL